MKVLIITGNEKRHRYFAYRLSRTLNVVGVFFEKKANKHEKKDWGAEQSTIDEHFAKRTASENNYFPEDYTLPTSIPVFEVGTGETNSDENFRRIKQIAPDVIQLFGSSIIKDHILESFPNRVINLHLGLSPYYRGSGTNFWPLVEGVPECVGATIHITTSEVDAGGILHQVRPDVAPGDTEHDLGNKTIVAAAGAIPDVLWAYISGQSIPQPQQPHTGKVFFRRDLTAASVRTLHNQIEKGIIEDYVANKQTRDRKFPVVEFK